MYKFGDKITIKDYSGVFLVICIVEHMMDFGEYYYIIGSDRKERCIHVSDITYHLA